MLLLKKKILNLVKTSKIGYTHLLDLLRHRNELKGLIPRRDVSCLCSFWK